MNYYPLAVRALLSKIDSKQSSEQINYIARVKGSRINFIRDKAEQIGEVWWGTVRPLKLQIEVLSLGVAKIIWSDLPESTLVAVRALLSDSARLVSTGR